MAMFRYAVLRMNNEWKIVCARRRMGHFATSEAAIAAARKLAHTAAADGHRTEILMQGPAGELEPVAFTHLALRDFDTAGLPAPGWPGVDALSLQPEPPKVSAA